ncbi:MAG TPA: TetR/AcrR family transcriptional regulator [Ktedonobacterales bacterium]|nr:TetR/AcrR family transcriptional regulator [Ktedonobacterales bacterium]
MVDQIGKKPKKAWTHHADNRERLIAAGYAIIAEKGIEAATVKEIAGRADVSPGLFHYYFKSRDKLLLAVLYKEGERFRQRVMEGIQAKLATQSFPDAAIGTLYALARQDPTWYRLRYELFALGLRKPDFLPEVARFLGAMRLGMTRAFMEFIGMDEARAQATAALILAGSDGLALQQIAQSDLDLAGAYDLMRLLLAGDSSVGH